MEQILIILAISVLGPIIGSFIGILKNVSNKVKAGDDAAEVKWFDIEKLPKDLAFDHNEVAGLGIRKLISGKTSD